MTCTSGTGSGVAMTIGGIVAAAIVVLYFPATGLYTKDYCRDAQGNITLPIELCGTGTAFFSRPEHTDAVLEVQTFSNTTATDVENAGYCYAEAGNDSVTVTGQHISGIRIKIRVTP